ncbi:MAG: MbtH family NRPS accessory protein [Paracoccaceae bacterium]
MTDEPQYHVVINNEEQYSIWATDMPIPEGWEQTGFTGLKADCLAHIDEVWTDMRPKSLRDKMDKAS